MHLDKTHHTPCPESGRASRSSAYRVALADLTETSNRQNTRDRAKITKKVSEHKRKTKRNAKKDVTWKSSESLVVVPLTPWLTRAEKKADPGVPSTFPYKDRVLAELAEEKRRVRHLPI